MKIILSASVGLFWLSDDFSDIIDIQGEHKISKADVLMKRLVQPKGLHAYYDFPRETPRGRVELNAGKLIIWVGEDFPSGLLSSLKDHVIGLFDLRAYSDRVLVKQHYHWNTKQGLNNAVIVE